MASVISPKCLFTGSKAPAAWVRFPSPAPLFVVECVSAIGRLYRLRYCAYCGETVSVPEALMVAAELNESTLFSART